MQSGNNEEYIDLVFERIDDASVLSNFYCGIPDMDDFIHEKLQGYLNRTGCEAFVIKQKNEIVSLSYSFALVHYINIKRSLEWHILPLFAEHHRRTDQNASLPLNFV